MAHEAEKIMEATHFHEEMVRAQNDPDLFRLKLSAFLSASRSVLQYALEEAKSKPGGQDWYDNKISTNELLGFFKDKRDANIHTEPVQLAKDVHIQLNSPITISVRVGGVVFKKNGEIVGAVDSEPILKKEKAKETPPTITHRYRFRDRQGEEGVIDLCSRYLDTLRTTVKEGQDSGYLTA